jgi:predicted homoserine dehydrogenase-like protein
MRLVAIANRHIEGALRCYEEAGISEILPAYDIRTIEDGIRSGRVVVTEHAEALAAADGVDALIEVTGTVEHAAKVVLTAIDNGKDVVLMNAELDGTVGPILQVRARQAGVVLTASDGDQPGVQMNLFRFVKSIGLRPLVCGNVKGLQDPYRNPTTQEGFARKWGQQPNMVTSFADGTKISFEQAIVANATGMTIASRGMSGYNFEGHVDDAMSLFDVDCLEALGGIVDYLVGAKPGPGVFVYATHDDPRQRHYLDLYKLGSGPLYSFYTPYHLCHFEVPLSVARAVLFRDPVLQPLAGPRVDVITTAKTDLRKRQTLDGLGGYTTYGQCETADVAARDRLLPIGLAEGCTLTRDIRKDEVLTYDDVTLPDGRLCDQLRKDQDRHFGMLPISASR